jgi:hypothetical protein
MDEYFFSLAYQRKQTEPEASALILTGLNLMCFVQLILMPLQQKQRKTSPSSCACARHSPEALFTSLVSRTFQRTNTFSAYISPSERASGLSTRQ